jgi:signal transduction histidine kinase
VDFEADPLPEGLLSPAAETALYRIVQEGLTNVVRHAQARWASVVLQLRGDALVLIIEDDGVGFDPQAAEATGRLGVVGMRERARSLGGRLTIESMRGQGTMIHVEVPCDDSRTDR